MFAYFVRKRHGVITIITAITLIAILSFSSLFTEIARYRALHALYKEMSDNAAFSTLSQYDEDLYNRFALLAMTQETDVEDYLDYLTTDMNLNNDEAVVIDRYLELTDNTEFEKIYDLQNLDVLKAQIMECSKYRTIIRGIDDFTNIEDLVKDLIKQAEKGLPVLNFLKELSGLLNNLIDMIVSAKEFSDSSVEYNKAIKAYNDAIKDYNEAIKERDDYADNHTQDDEDYAEKMAEKAESVQSVAAKLKGAAEEAKAQTISYEKALKAYQSAYEKFQGGAIEALLSEELAKIEIGSDGYGEMDNEERESVKEMIEDMQETFGDTNSIMEEIKKGVDNLQKQNFADAINGLQAQITALEPVVADGTKGSTLEAVDAVCGSFWAILTTVITTLDNISKLIDSLNEMLSILENYGKFLELQFSLNYGFHPSYNNYYKGELPSRNMSKKQYDFIESDRKIVTLAAEKADKILKSSWPSTSLTLDNSEIAFFAHIQDVSEKLEKVSEEYQTLKATGGIIRKLIQLGKLVLAVAKLLGSMISLAMVIVAQTVGQLVKILYQHFEVSVYATSMFPNRVSEGDDKNLLGNSWSDYSDYWADDGLAGRDSVDTDNFSWARAEYIYTGSRSEKLNQQIVFIQLLLFRMLLNLPTIFMDEKIMEAIEGMCSCIIGIIVAVIVILIIAYAESMIDMVFLVGGGDTVPFVKKGLYLMPENIMKVVTEINKIMKYDAEMKMYTLDGEEIKKEKTTKTQELKKVISDYGEEFGWDYEAYLTFFVMWHPTNLTVKRTADLIQMEMAATKKEKYETTPFKLNEMYTGLRVETEAEFRPLLPIPSVPDANGSKFKISNISYACY